ncbi:MAG: hypothetical protein AB7I19_20465 [Planctomycetota bacterium]
MLPSLISTVLTVLSTFAAHPHVPKAIRLHGANGPITVQYFTVPYNPEHLADLKPGFEWHLGFAAFENEVVLQSGGQTVPPTRWKLGVVRGEADGQWSLLLEPFELWQGRRGAQRNQEARERFEQLRERLEKDGIPARVVLPMKAQTAEAAEHLEMLVIHRGYTAAQRLSNDPAGGVEFTLRLDFGDIHFTCDLNEVFVPKKSDDQPAGGADKKEVR